MNYFTLLFCWCLTVSFSWAAQEGLSREVPALYSEQLENLLTPVEEVLKWENPFLDSDESDGTVLLSERITWVDEKGLCVDVIHSVFQAHTDAGASQLESDRVGYSALLESPILVYARTLGKDGQWTEVGEKEAFLQRGRGNSRSQIYDDREEVILIFPEVEAGAVTESIVILKDKSARVEGEYFSVNSWEAGWPYLMRRRVIDLPGEMASQLQENTLGSGVPKRVEMEAPDGRWRAKWEKQNRDRAYWEPSRAPTAQVGPATYLTTWDSWGDLAAWYSEKLEKNSQLGPELLEEVANWLGEEKDKEVIARILLERISLDVRYTGLEFGHSGLEPYGCMTVWNRKFGDCKDKANLLVQLLRHYGIEAKVVLVNTEHAGLVNRKSPSYQEFNHAIAAVRQGEEWVFCDPTIPGTELGLLAPSSSDREVFLIGKNGGEWARTPEGELPVLRYEFETGLDTEGRLSGYMKLRASGYYEQSYRDDYRERSLISARRFLTDQLKEFFEGAEVVDIEFPEDEEGFVVKAFFTGQPSEPDSKGRRVLPFPVSSNLFLDFGEGDDRETSFFMWRDEIEVSSVTTLPEGLTVESLPRPITLENEGYRIAASWQNAESGCRAELKISSRDSLLTPEEVLVVAQANRAFASWSESPVFIVSGKNDQPHQVEQASPKMPLLSSGEAQLELVEQWFPLGADSVRRRTALRDVIRFFPNDQEVSFDVKAHLAYLDYYEDENEKAVQQYRALAKNTHVSAEQKAYASYMLAVVQDELGEREEARAIMKELARQENLSEYRRGWSASWAATWLLPDSPDEAEKYGRIALSLEGDFRPNALDALVGSLLKQEEKSRLAIFLEEELSQDEEALPQELAQVVKVPENGAESQLMAEAFEVVLQGLPEDDPRQQLFRGSREKVTRGLQQQEASREIVKKLRALLAEEKPEYFHRAQVAAEDETREDFEDKLSTYYNEKHDLWLAYASEYIKRFEPDDEFTTLLWYLLGYIDWLEDPSDEKEDFFGKMVRLTDEIPHADDNYWECQFVKASWLEKRKRYQEANELYAAMAVDPDFNEDFNTSAATRQGLVLEKLGRWAEAVDCYRRTEGERRTVLNQVHHLVRAAILLVHLERDEEALEVFSLFRDVPTSLYEDSELRPLITEGLFLLENADGARQFWRSSRENWRRGFGKGSSIQLNKPFGSVYLMDEELTAFDQEFPNALKTKDRQRRDEMTAGVYAVASVFPSRVEVMTTLTMTYLKPNEPAGETESYRALVGFAEIVLAAPITQTMREFCWRICGGLKIDMDEEEEAFLIIAKCVDQFNDASSREHQERASYLYLLAAIKAKKKPDDVLAQAERILSEEMSYLERLAFVQSAAQLVAQTQGPEEAFDFVMAQSQIRAGDLTASVKKDLVELAEGLRGPDRVQRDLVDAFDEWMGDLSLTWFTHIEPQVIGVDELDEARLFLRTGENDQHPLELFKLMAQVLRSPDAGEALATDALYHCLSEDEVWTNSHMVSLEKMSEAILDERFPHAIRSKLYLSVLAFAASLGEVEAYQALKSKPIWKEKGSPIGSKFAAWLDILFEAHTTQEFEPVLAHFRAAQEKAALESIDISVAGGYFEVLLSQGELELIAQLLKESKDWKVEAGSRAVLQEKRLTWGRALRQLKPYRELNESLRALLSDLLTGDVADAPKDWSKRTDETLNDDWSDDEKRGVLVAKLSPELWKASSLDLFLWTSDCFLWAEDEEGQLHEGEVLKAVEVILNWSQDTDAAMALVSFFDLDYSKEGEERMSELLAPYNDPRENPELYAVKTLWAALSQDEPGKLRTAGLLVAAEEASFFQEFIDFTTLFFAISNGNRKESEKILDTMEGERLLRPRVLLPSIRLMQDVGTRDIELEIAQEKAAAAIDEAVLDSWQNPQIYFAHFACELAASVGEGERLPKVWARSVRRKLPERENRLAFDAVLAWAKEDWLKLEKAASQAYAISPEFDYQALWGKALFEQGRHEEALVHLQAAVEVPVIDRDIFLNVESILQDAEQELQKKENP